MYNQGGQQGYNPRQLPPHLDPSAQHARPPPSGPRQHGNYPPISQPDFSRPPPGYQGPPGGVMGGFPNFPPPGFAPPPMQQQPRGLPGRPNVTLPPPPVPQKELSAQTTLFVGSIAPGVTDPVLEQLLNACGPLRLLKRVSGATGKPQAFGFAEYQDPDSVLRALSVLNGVELPDLQNRGNPGKKLVVKADDNTRKFLDEYEAQMLRTDADDQLELSAVKSITAILQALNNGTALPTSTSTALGSSSGNPNPAATAPPVDPFAIPEHLRDLQSDELPDETRDAVLSQISSFRVTSVEREQAKKRQEEEIERRRIEAMIFEQNQTRTREQQAAMRAKQVAEEKEREKERLGRGAPFGDGPQGWSKPVGFVAASGSGGAVERTDEEEEELRKERRRRDQADTLRERERRVEQRERQRLHLIDRELNAERQRQIEAEGEHRSMKERLARWDDDEQEERGRDLWYSDRPRWRSQRLPIRRREEADDEADRRAEVEEAAALQRESEEFLDRQMKDLAELAVKQKAAGILTDDVGPVKLNIVAKPLPPPPTAPVAPILPVAEGRVFVEEEEEEVKKKRVLVKLDYGETQEERELKRVQALAKIRLEKLPKTSESLFASVVKWEAITETIIDKKFTPLVRKQLIKYLGDMEDDDLLKFVLDHLREKKSAADLVEGLEPILEDEATPFTVSIWRAVIFESIALSEGVETKEVTVE